MALRQTLKKVLPAPVFRAAKNVYLGITRQSRPRQTRFLGDAEGVLDCCVAYNKYGAYCIPRSGLHRPAAQKVLAGHVWEAPTIEYMIAHCGAGDIVHAGTFFGDFVPALSHACVTGAKVWAFEPHPESHRCAALTIQLNSLKNVVLTHAGLGEKPGSLSFVTKDASGRSLGGSSHFSQAPAAERTSTIEVPVATIDSAVPADRQVSIIQLDVEGFEKQALSGAFATIRRCKPILLLETPPDARWMADNILALGYRTAGEVYDNAIYLPEGRG
jgi:FkbM family methyltransferase